MKNIIKRIINFLFMIFKIDEKRILFECGRGMIDGSPKAIYDYLKSKHPNEYKLMWIVSKDTDVTGLDKKDYCYVNTIKSFYERAISKYWLKSESIASLIKKRKKQVYIQLWHGHGALKKMGYDVIENKTGEPLEHTKEWDYLIVNDPLDEKIMISSTGYQGNILMIGTPLTDSILINSKRSKFKKDILKKLNINNDNPIILYAPTFRDDDLDKETIDLRINRLKEIKDYTILLRVHPLVRNKIDETLFEDSNIINVCKYPDSSDLLSITDILISDYSSIIYEYSILNKPIIFYAYDLEKYEKERGFYLKYPEDLPGVTVYTEDELYNAITNIKKDFKSYNKKLDTFNKKYNSLNDGTVCERFYKLLKEGYFK